MATFNNKETIDRIIAANGVLYPDETPVAKIVEYTNAWGGRCWGVVFENEMGTVYGRERYNIPTDHIINPVTIFERNKNV